MKLYQTLAFLLWSVAGMAQKGENDISRGNEYYQAGQFDLAEKYYRTALKKDPASTTAAYNLANALHGQKRFKEAIGVLQTIPPQKQNAALQAAIHYNTGVNHTRERDLEASIAAYKDALRFAPDDKQARENLQKALRELRQEQQQKQQQQNRSSMSKSEAQRKLDQLQQKEREIQERMNRNRSREGQGMAKDW
ncbi:Tetratricopeptide repeat-containing protein [Cnuella takakiae]|uniref:Tetratricopeptide repeat-containing protein n=1 Tax=Cnuella takakiae TaxID=1302690 RepID=A0A1M5DPT6_9BACT|nr:tetratricopeptide repeat protein [Cnuella takakiae]OLY93909.1 hypothetical protein BUE76_20010 [Cnuella takakiae]SHF69038.1 Tetratricopeptide repeat-containing protein [Cnuella takakiae]